MIRPSKKKHRVNPNIQSTSTRKHKDTGAESTKTKSDSDSDSVTVSYKSKRMAMPAGPSDQGATSKLVGIITYKTLLESHTFVGEIIILNHFLGN